MMMMNYDDYPLSNNVFKKGDLTLAASACIGPSFSIILSSNIDDDLDVDVDVDNDFDNDDDDDNLLKTLLFINANDRRDIIIIITIVNTSNILNVCIISGIASYDDNTDNDNIITNINTFY